VSPRPRGADVAALDVLILEDAAGDAKLVERALRAGGVEFAARRTEGREDFHKALLERRPDAILADYKLPEFDGLAALRMARELYPDTPVIIVTGTLSDEAAVQLLREGAADYILKDRLSRLAPAVRRAIDEARIEAARREAEEKYRVLFTEARDGIALLDPESGAIADCNPEFERQTGRTLLQLQAASIWDLGPRASMDGVRRALAAGPGGGGVEAELEFHRADGTEIAVELRAKTIDLRGRRYVQALFRDVTERRRAERELREQLDELRRFQKVTVDREIRLEELEAELARLRKRSPVAAR
jgi:PAS domain S-box-containing protein